MAAVLVVVLAGIAVVGAVVAALCGQKLLGALLLAVAVASVVLFAVLTGPSGLESKVARRQGWDAGRTRCERFASTGGEKIFFCAQHTGGFLDEFDGPPVCVALRGKRVTEVARQLCGIT